MFDAIGSAPQIQAGALRALGVTATARLRVLPDIPPIGDVVPGFAVTGWLGIGGGHATMAATSEREDAIIDYLRRQFGHVSAERVV
jgi:tripartite-type tricarboxylate transporter receptor subunit TctC